MLHTEEKAKGLIVLVREFMSCMLYHRVLVRSAKVLSLAMFVSVYVHACNLLVLVLCVSKGFL